MKFLVLAVCFVSALMLQSAFSQPFPPLGVPGVVGPPIVPPPFPFFGGFPFMPFPFFGGFPFLGFRRFGGFGGFRRFGRDTSDVDATLENLGNKIDLAQAEKVQEKKDLASGQMISEIDSAEKKSVKDLKKLLGSKMDLDMLQKKDVADKFEADKIQLEQIEKVAPKSVPAADKADKFESLEQIEKVAPKSVPAGDKIQADRFESVEQIEKVAPKSVPAADRTDADKFESVEQIEKVAPKSVPAADRTDADKFESVEQMEKVAPKSVPAADRADKFESLEQVEKVAPKSVPAGDKIQADRIETVGQVNKVERDVKKVEFADKIQEGGEIEKAEQRKETESIVESLQKIVPKALNVEAGFNVEQ